MHRLLWPLLVLFAGGVLAALILAANLYWQERTRASATDWILATSVAALESGDADIILNRLTDEARAEAPEDFWSTYFRSLGALGDWQAVEAARITEADIPDWWARDEGISLEAELDMRFRNDSPTVRVRVRRANGEWRIQDFIVMSRLLAA